MNKVNLLKTNKFAKHGSKYTSRKDEIKIRLEKIEDIRKVNHNKSFNYSHPDESVLKRRSEKDSRAGKSTVEKLLTSIKFLASEKRKLQKLQGK